MSDVVSGACCKRARATAVAKERELLKQEITPALMAHFVRPETKRNRSSASLRGS
jgi:hypothetical protein